jgi:8-oxo-dGTP diphosphatase
MNTSQSVRIVRAIVVADGKILLLLRDDNPKIRDPNCWQLPGGGVEDGETPDEAIKRELQEEIGIIPSSLRFLTSPSTETHAYFARLTNQEVKNIKKGNEGNGLLFFSFDELSQISLTQKLKDFIQSQGKFLKSLLG